MKDQQIKQALFSERTRVYAVLDGASIPDLLQKLYEMPTPNVCLYRGELEPDVAEAAPYLVNLLPDAPLTNWIVADGAGKHWGIFAHCPFNLTEMRKHFRSLLTVHDAQGQPLLFRYYDPRVMNQFLPTCEPEELEKMFGKITKYFAESEDAANLNVFKFENGELQQSEIELETKQ